MSVSYIASSNLRLLAVIVADVVIITYVYVMRICLSTKQAFDSVYSRQTLHRREWKGC